MTPEQIQRVDDYEENNKGQRVLSVKWKNMKKKKYMNLKKY